MRPVALLVVLGASLARGVSLEQRDLESEDTSGNFVEAWTDIAERHDNGFPAAQYPLAQTDNPLVEITPIGPNLDAEGINTVNDQVTNSVGPSIVHNPPSEENNQANIHMLKRVPGFITFTERFYSPIVPVTLFRGISVFVTYPAGSEVVTATEEGVGPLTVRFPTFVFTRTTQIFTVTETVYRVTVPPASATEEFLTSAYFAETLARTATIIRFTRLPITVISPETVTVTEDGRLTVTVTEKSTYFITASQTTFIPVTTRTIVVPEKCPAPTIDTQSVPAPVTLTVYVTVPV